MTVRASLFALAASALLVGCALPADGGAGDDDGERSTEGLTSCTIKTATGYKSGTPFTIKVVTVDGKPVEINTAMAYLKLQAAAKKKGVSIWIVSGFRTMDQQKALYAAYLNGTGNLAAKPGYSNHQSGHALDLNTSSPGVYSFLSTYGASYGFKRTVPSEIWHWEYWGPAVAGPCTDGDKDGIINEKDNCPTVANKTQADLDKDGKGDACDADDDGDGVPDDKDNCPRDKNATQTDSDKDGKGDVCDADDDGDGVADAKDNCPKLKNPGQEDLDGDGKGDACDDDEDGDGVPNAKDNCPEDKNADQLDTDGDGIGDVCEPPPPPPDPTTDPSGTTTGDDTGAPEVPGETSDLDPSAPTDAPAADAPRGDELPAAKAGSCSMGPRSTTTSFGLVLGLAAFAAARRRRR